MIARHDDGLNFFRGMANALLVMAAFVAGGLAVAGEYRPLALLLAAACGYFVGRGQAEARPARRVTVLDGQQVAALHARAERRRRLAGVRGGRDSTADVPPEGPAAA